MAPAKYTTSRAGMGPASPRALPSLSWFDRKARWGGPRKGWLSPAGPADYPRPPTLEWSSSERPRGAEPAAARSVLLVEDDALLRAAMQLVLEWEGYRVLCAGDGQEALDLLRSGERPGLILLDAVLPVLDGWAFRQEQQRDPALASIPVLVVSGHDVSGSLDAAGHLHKPFQPEDLLEAIRHLG